MGLRWAEIKCWFLLLPYSLSRIFPSTGHWSLWPLQSADKSLSSDEPSMKGENFPPGFLLWLLKSNFWVCPNLPTKLEIWKSLLFSLGSRLCWNTRLLEILSKQFHHYYCNHCTSRKSSAGCLLLLWDVAVAVPLTNWYYLSRFSHYRFAGTLLACKFLLLLLQKTKNLQYCRV